MQYQVKITQFNKTVRLFGLISEGLPSDTEIEKEVEKTTDVTVGYYDACIYYPNGTLADQRTLIR